MPWSCASWWNCATLPSARPLQPQFELSCFIFWMTGVYTLCGSRPDAVVDWSTLMPFCAAIACCTASPRLASWVSLGSTNAPWILLPNFFL